MCLLIIFILLINHFIFTKRKTKQIYKTLAYLFVFLIVLELDNIASMKYGDHIGNFFEGSGYTASYYSNFYTSEKSNRNYKLESSITRDKETGDYFLLSAVWKDGEILHFEDKGYNYPLKVNEKVRVIDDNEKIWFVELTNVRVR